MKPSDEYKVCSLEDADVFARKRALGRGPLSNEEIHELANEYLRTQNQDGRLIVLGLEDFARAIEERHGIK